MPTDLIDCPDCNGLTVGCKRCQGKGKIPEKVTADENYWTIAGQDWDTLAGMTVSHLQEWLLDIARMKRNLAIPDTHEQIPGDSGSEAIADGGPTPFSENLWQEMKNAQRFSTVLARQFAELEDWIKASIKRIETHHPVFSECKDRDAAEKAFAARMEIENAWWKCRKSYA
jgi:hypothetical protein